jgi:hypothetical protein
MRSVPARPTNAERRVRLAFLAGADVDLRGTEVRAGVLADLLARGVDRSAHPRAALRLANATVRGPLDLRHAEIPVHVSFAGCTFTDALDLTEVRALSVVFLGCSLPGLRARLLDLRGDLALRQCTVTGLVDLRFARVGGDVDFGRTVLRNPSGPALAAERLTVAGSFMARHGFTADGDVLLIHAEVGNQVNFTNATLGATSGFGLHLGGARAGSVWLTFAAPPAGRVRLSGLQVESMFDDPDTWPAALELVGCTYRLLIGRKPAAPGQPLPIERVDVRKRLDWLRRDPEGYAPQPYEQLAEAYRNSGQAAEARRVLLEQQRRRRATLRWPGRMLGYALDGLVGYGYRTWLAAGWLALFWALGTLTFVVQPPDARDPAAAPEPNPALQALDLLLPIIDLGHDGAWNPVGWSQYVAALLVLAGWVLTTAVVAGIARVFNR